MSNGTKVLAPNGQSYTFHYTSASGGTSGYVYALGHRVYGRLGELKWDDGAQAHVRLFKPKFNGKWSFTVAAVESAPVTESASA